MAGWLSNPKLGAFAARVLEKIAVGADAEAVHDVLWATLPDVSTPSVRNDIQAILVKIEPAITLRQTQAWMAAQPRAGGSRWTAGDAERLVAKVERLAARRRAAGKLALGDMS